MAKVETNNVVISTSEVVRAALTTVLALLDSGEATGVLMGEATGVLMGAATGAADTGVLTGVLVGAATGAAVTGVVHTVVDLAHSVVELDLQATNAQTDAVHVL